MTRIDQHPSDTWVSDYELPFPNMPVIDRRDLLFPAVTLQTFDPSLAAMTRPFFDALWNASGRPACPPYSDGRIF